MSTSVARALAAPSLQATVSDLEFAHTVLLVGCEPVDDAPILDLRIRKGVRRNGVKLAIAGARPSSLDPTAHQILRCPPGGEAAMLAGIEQLLRGGESPSEEVDGPHRPAARRRQRRDHRVGRADRRDRREGAAADRPRLELATTPGPDC